MTMPQIFNDRAMCWLPIEEMATETMVQVQRLSALPFIYRHIAVIPDCHPGAGATVGICIASQEAVMPAAVGTDIGCGMIATRTTLTKTDIPEELKQLRQNIERDVALGNARSGSYEERLATMDRLAGPRLAHYDRIDPGWRDRLGTLGSGNHFVELTLDEDDRVWAFLHSGSRTIGKEIALQHIAAAKRECRERRVRLPDPDFAFLQAGTEPFNEYDEDLRWAQEFARLNRAEMTDKLLDVMSDQFPAFKAVETVECHHNFCQWEEHFGDRVLVTRKGTIEARAGQPGLIPGSMGARSYVVAGRGCAEAFNSAPHGAGRRMSRSTAKAVHTMADFDDQMAGIEVRRSPAFLDELPAAYQDIDTVMEHARDLIEPIHTLRQFVNVKGE